MGLEYTIYKDEIEAYKNSLPKVIADTSLTDVYEMIEALELFLEVIPFWFYEHLRSEIDDFETLIEWWLSQIQQEKETQALNNWKNCTPER